MLYNKIKDIREENDLKLRDIDKILNLEPDTYRKFENETAIMPIKHLNTVCNYLNVSLDYVFGFTKIKKYKNNIDEIDIIKSGKRLKEFRKEHKLTQDKLAKQLNIAKSLLSYYENGSILISTHALYEICKKYKISADYLLGKVDEPKYLK